MEWLTLILIIALITVLLKYKKHQWHIYGVRYLTIIILMFLILIVSAYYVNIGDFLNKDSALSKTGAVVFESVRDNVDFSNIFSKNHFSSLADKSIDFIEKSLDKLRNN